MRWRFIDVELKQITRAAAILGLTAVMGLGLTACGGAKANTEFLSGTTVNGQDVSLLGVEEAAAYLQECADKYQLSLQLNGETPRTITFSGADLNLTYNEATDLQAMLDQQNADETQLEFTVDDLYTYDLNGVQPILNEVNSDLKAESDQLVEQMKQELAAQAAEAAGSEEASSEEAPAEGAEEEGEAAGGETPEQPATELQIPDPYAPKDAALAYDEQAQDFVITPAQYGRYINAAAVMGAMDQAVAALEPALTLEPDAYGEAPQLTEEAPEMQAALAEAQSYLALDLTYSFTPNGGETSTVTLDRPTLASLFLVGEDGRTLEVDEEALGSYVNTLAETYAGESTSSQFKTTGGSYINISVTSAGQSVDSQALYTDMLESLRNKATGTREAPYAAQDDQDAGFWGGNYVEIDLSSQHLWCYRNGECVVSCSVVSGCVVNKTTTPTGCFTIFAKDSDRYLKGTNIDGSTYNSYVSYFMPFSGGCGIHDATWRSNFGGDIYLYSGSHGCVGVTLGNAKKIFNNVSVGTHVVVYGGRTSVDPIAQNLSASVSTNLVVGDTATIGVSGAGTTPAFASDNPGVVTVDGSGNIVAMGVGTATITISCPASTRYQAGTTTVTITVSEKVCPHDWIAQTEIVHHEAVTHTEPVTVVDQEAYDETVYTCSACSATFSSQADADAHVATHATESGSAAAATVSSSTVQHEAVTHTEDKVVEDQAAYDEEVVVGYACSLCGATKGPNE